MEFTQKRIRLLPRWLLRAPLPKQAIFPLGQHIGAPDKPVVAKGDKVKVGTLIAVVFFGAVIFSTIYSKMKEPAENPEQAPASSR